MRKMKHIIGKHAKKSKETSSFGQVLKEKMYAVEPEDFTVDDFVGMAADEAWNLDEFTSDGYIMLKNMLFRLLTNKKDWDNHVNPAPIQMDEFREIVRKAYKKKLK